MPLFTFCEKLFHFLLLPLFRLRSNNCKIKETVPIIAQKYPNLPKIILNPRFSASTPLLVSSKLSIVFSSIFIKNVLSLLYHAGIPWMMPVTANQFPPRNCFVLLE